MPYSENALDYLASWTQEFGLFQDFSWVSLRNFPSWAEVKISMKKVAEKTPFDEHENSSKVLEQYSYIKNYCNEEKLSEWNSKNLTTDERWVEIFKYMETQNVPFIEFSQIIEFVICFPGSSASVERVFSLAKRVWKQESSALQVSTLKSILTVKFNVEYTCMDFYNFIKTQPQLLRKIGSQEKYDFKQPNAERGPGAMSVDMDSDDRNE